MFGLQKQNHEHVQVFCPFWWKLPEKIRLQNKKNTNEFLYLIFVQHFCAKIRVNLHKSSVSSPSIVSLFGVNNLCGNSLEFPSACGTFHLQQPERGGRQQGKVRGQRSGAANLSRKQP